MTELQKEKDSGNCQIMHCILSHISDDIKEMNNIMEIVIEDIERLNDPETSPNNAYSDDEDLVHDLQKFYVILNKFKSKYKEDLGL
jgi:hypothetical protein